MPKFIVAVLHVERRYYEVEAPTRAEAYAAGNKARADCLVPTHADTLEYGAVEVFEDEGGPQPTGA